jgi:hypothetical protein
MSTDPVAVASVARIDGNAANRLTGGAIAAKKTSIAKYKDCWKQQQQPPMLQGTVSMNCKL